MRIHLCNKIFFCLCAVQLILPPGLRAEPYDYAPSIDASPYYSNAPIEGDYGVPTPDPNKNYLSDTPDMSAVGSGIDPNAYYERSPADEMGQVQTAEPNQYFPSDTPDMSATVPNGDPNAPYGVGSTSSGRNWQAGDSYAAPSLGGHKAIRLQDANGQPVSACLLSPPIDYTGLGFAAQLEPILLDILREQGVSNIYSIKDQLRSVTQEGFEQVSNQTGAKLIFVAIVNRTEIALYLYDVRTPAKVYAVHQPIPDPGNFAVSKSTVDFLSRPLVQNLLYHYLDDFYYDLPSKPAPVNVKPYRPVIRVQVVSESPFYATVGLGAMAGSGSGTESYVRWLMSARFGIQIKNNFFGEIGLDHFVYNAWMAFLKYQRFPTLKKTIGYGFGLGASLVTGRSPLDGVRGGVPQPDPTPGVQLDGFYIAPTAELIFKLWDVDFKISTLFLWSKDKRILGGMGGVFIDL